MMRMGCWGSVWFLAWIGSLTAAADLPGSFSGAWKTTFGPVVFEQKGQDVTGQIIAFKLPVKGKLTGKTLTASYDEGQVHVDAMLELDDSGTAFTGTFQASNGNGGVWNGWRPDPAAAQGEPANFAGLWLTDLGLMELEHDGPRVKGRYALRGTSSLEGTIQGRHLEFHLKSFRFTGPGWFDLDPAGRNLTGAGGTDGMPAWYGWKGRKAAEFVRHVPLVAGKTVDGSTQGLLTYSVRAPEAYKDGDTRKWPVVLVLHGSNMNGKAYVNTIAATWPDIARDFILLGINGEKPSNLATDNPAFNYTYVNYVGRSTYQGFPGTDRESPALVREALEELRDAYPVKHYLAGGHSQGGFLTYSLLMNSPELIAGAFPSSAGVIFQCEPSAYEDPVVKAAQRAVPLAIVHGKTDPSVPFDGAAYAYGLFLDAGWPAVRFFADDSAGHMFARLPVDKAIRWLEALASDDPRVLLAFAERSLAEQHDRDACAAIRRVETRSLDSSTKLRLQALTEMINTRAAPAARQFLEAIRADKDNSWVDGFLTFRETFEYAPAAAEAIAAFNAVRARHNPPAQKLMGEARSAFQQGRRGEGFARLTEIVEKYYASSSYRLARKWLAEQR
jgi:predicted esterase